MVQDAEENINFMIRLWEKKIHVGYVGDMVNGGKMDTLHYYFKRF